MVMGQVVEPGEWVARAEALVGDDPAAAAQDPPPLLHTNNWAVIVLTLRFWFNYRHMANALLMYRTVKRLGIPDSQIILMLPDDMACNLRNAFPGAVFNNNNRQIDLYGELIEVDYRGYDVTVEAFIRLLTDRWPADHPRLKRLLTDLRLNIFIYMTGHGGNEFLKFQDAEEISGYDIADAFEQMHENHRYNEILFMIDTCQANTMYQRFYLPNILAVGLLEYEELSFSHHADVDIGVAVIDRFTYFNLEFLEGCSRSLDKTLADLFGVYTFENIHLHAGIRTDLFKRDPSKVLLTDFFGNVQRVVKDERDDNVLYLLVHSEENPLLDVGASAPLAPWSGAVQPAHRGFGWGREETPEAGSSWYAVAGVVSLAVFVAGYIKL